MRVAIWMKTNEGIKYSSTTQRILAMLALVLAGEAIFFLPFVLARVFRPTLLTVFEINNFELGLAFSAYGTVAMVSYFLGGPLADRFPAAKLMSVALAITAVGGVFMATIPSLSHLKLLYAFWGITTILLFWAALIRATREWGGAKLQGSAFGFLDGGRGLVAAGVSSIAVTIFAAWLPIDVKAATLPQLKGAFSNVILFFSLFTFCIAILVWFVLPSKNTTQETSSPFSLQGIRKIFAMRVVWLQAIIIVCAYVGYKTTDDFSLYAKDVLGFDDVQAANVGTMALWIRPIVAISAGLIANKLTASRMIILSFFIMLAGSLAVGMGLLNSGLVWLFFITIATTTVGIYMLRSLYFAIMGEGKIPLLYTGTAVGFISVIGYTPDIFMGPLMGHLLDSSPGALGHQHLFLMLAGFSVVGLVAAILFRKLTKEA